MKVELQMRWGHYPKGFVLTPPDGMANELIRRGIAAEVVEQEQRIPKPKVKQKC